MEMAFVLSSSTPTPLTATSRRSRASSGSNDGKLLWEAHFAGIEREYCQIEKLANLEQLPSPHGFKVACFPVKLEGGSAGWTRVVAMVEE
jgi:kynurenine formamidase